MKLNVVKAALVVAIVNIAMANDCQDKIIPKTKEDLLHLYSIARLKTMEAKEKLDMKNFLTYSQEVEYYLIRIREFEVDMGDE